MTDDQIATLSRAIDPFSYIGAHAAMVRTSTPETMRQVLDTGATDATARIFTDIDAAENHLFVIFAIALPIAFALLTIPLWS